jgi:hypothetical protein
MRAIAGALLVVAGAILGGATILAEATGQSQGHLGNHAALAYLVAAVVALFGLVVVIVGLVEYQRHQLPRHQRHLLHQRHDE